MRRGLSGDAGGAGDAPLAVGRRRRGARDGRQPPHAAVGRLRRAHRDRQVRRPRVGVAALARAPPRRRGRDARQRARRRRPGRARDGRSGGRGRAPEPLARACSTPSPTTSRTRPAIPNDPRFGELYGLHNTGQAGGAADADIDAPEGWDAAGLRRLSERAERREDRHRRHRRAGRARGPRRQGRRLRRGALVRDRPARAPHAAAVRRPDDRRRALRRRQRPRHARRRHRGGAGRTTAAASPAWRSTRRWRSARRSTARARAPWPGSRTASATSPATGAKVISLSLGTTDGSATLRNAVAAASGAP